ncbi:MAG: hypothetical protein M3Q93_09245 [Gemmatimonadota bacterium]|nr:hypothetical protein [Gemmatimonadota bacterium]
MSLIPSPLRYFHRSARAGLVLPLGLTVGLLAARAAAAPPLDDPLGSPLPPTLGLDYPALYVALAPLFSLWDSVSMLSMSRLRGFLTGLLVLYVLWRGARALWRRLAWSDGPAPRAPVRRELGLLLAALAGVVLFVAGGLLWHRPMARLAGAGPDAIVFDVHSHTNVSHDVRGTLMRGFDVAATQRWHRRAGFDAFFVTDHNTVEGLREGSDPPVACPGIEISAWRAHVVLLGDTGPVDRTRYNGSLEELRALLVESDSAYGALSVLSLPEYDRNHWAGLDSLAAAGADGLEIVNASPKANEFPRVRRDSAVALARRTGLFVVGASDSHGWGATSMVWNLMPLPGARPAGRVVCDRLLEGLEQGFGSSRIVERHRLRGDDAWPGWLTPLGVVWETWRGMNGTLTAAWLAWIWLLWAVPRRRYT